MGSCGGIGKEVHVPRIHPRQPYVAPRNHSEPLFTSPYP